MATRTEIALAILAQLRGMTTPEEDFFAERGYKPGELPPVHLQPSGFLRDQMTEEEDLDDFIADISGDRLCDEYATLVELIRQARTAPEE